MLKNGIHPDNVLVSILAKNPRADKKDKLNKLHEICAHQHSNLHTSIGDFSLSNMGRICQIQGLFKTDRTLYNAGSEDYVLLINAWAIFSGPVSVKLTKKEFAFPPEHKYLEKIEDHALRQIMQGVIAQRDKYKQQLDVLKSQTKFVVDQRPLSRASSLDSTSQVHEWKLTESERGSLAHAIASEFIEDRGWHIGDDGEIYTNSKAVIYEPGYVTAIRKILGE